MPAGGPSGQKFARHSTEDLLKYARDAGHPTTRRRITDWVSQGLLDNPSDRGRGQAKGKDYTWPDSQRALLLTLLDLQSQGRTRHSLLNVPVVTWLVWDDSYVPQRQTRKAMKSWARRARFAGGAAADRTLPDTLAQLNHPHATKAARHDLKDMLRGVAYGRPLDRAKLLERVSRVFDPDDAGVSRGPLGALTPEAFVSIIEMRIDTATRIVDDDIDNDTYVAARRDFLRRGPLSPYITELIIGTSMSTAALAALEAARNSACLHLLHALGGQLATAAQNDTETN